MPHINLCIVPFHNEELYDEDVENTYSYKYNQMVNDPRNIDYVTKFKVISLNLCDDPTLIYLEDFEKILKIRTHAFYSYNNLDTSIRFDYKYYTPDDNLFQENLPANEKKLNKQQGFILF